MTLTLWECRVFWCQNIDSSATFLFWGIDRRHQTLNLVNNAGTKWYHIVFSKKLKIEKSKWQGSLSALSIYLFPLYGSYHLTECFHLYASKYRIRIIDWRSGLGGRILDAQYRNVIEPAATLSCFLRILLCELFQRRKPTFIVFGPTFNCWKDF